MPEYLRPGVYIEETTFRSKSIEGVSTSTAGLVGQATKGRPGKPTLVTSFADFRRKFGQPFSISPGASVPPGAYLGHAVKAFFDNGGSRAYIVRAVNGAAPAKTATPAAPVFPVSGWVDGLARGTIGTLPPGRVLPKKPAAPANTVVVPLTSLRGLSVGGTGTPPSSVTVNIFTRDSHADAYKKRGPFTVTALDPARNEVTIETTVSAGEGLDSAKSYPAEHVFVTIVGSDPAVAGAPIFQARDEGSEGNSYAVQIRSADRPAVAITAATAVGSAGTGTVLTVASTANVYVGAIVEIDLGGSSHSKVYSTVSGINAETKTVTVGHSVTLTAAYQATLRVLEIDVLIYDADGVAESFTGLTWNPDPAAESFSRYYVQRINDSEIGSKLVEVTVPPPAPFVTTAPLASQPVTISGRPVPLADGHDGGDLDAIALIGADNGPGARTGIEALREKEDIALVAVPGVTDPEVQAALLVHCEQLKYRLAILDGFDTGDVTALGAHRNRYDSKYGAYYTPWLQTRDAATGRTTKSPPSGYVLGICARVDNERGVHKAPANEVVRGALGVTLPFSNGEQDVLNPQGINLIREFEGRGIRVWGGRCITSDSEWKYINVRRLFIYLEHSLDRGTQWVVFEPNNEALWQRVVDSVGSFLFNVWKSGALIGTTPEQAYFVRCDRTTMTQNDIDNGRLVCEVGVAPAYPAEFVVFRIGQFTASSNT